MIAWLSLCTDDSLFIQLLVNEHHMAIPECGNRSGSDLCPLSDLKRLVTRTQAETLSDICTLWHMPVHVYYSKFCTKMSQMLTWHGDFSTCCTKSCEPPGHYTCKFTMIVSFWHFPTYPLTICSLTKIMSHFFPKFWGLQTQTACGMYIFHETPGILSESRYTIVILHKSCTSVAGQRSGIYNVYIHIAYWVTLSNRAMWFIDCLWYMNMTPYITNTCYNYATITAWNPMYLYSPATLYRPLKCYWSRMIFVKSL